MPLQSSKGKEPQSANLLGVHNTANLGVSLGGGSGGNSHSGVQATGGAKYEPGDGYVYHYFVGSQGGEGSSDVVHDFFLQNNPGGSEFGIYMVAGGGGGGQWPFGGSPGGSGGGGGGGVVTNGALTGVPMVSGSYTITVGAGGNAQSSGGNTKIVGPPDYPGTIQANGGGNGGLGRPVTGHYDGGRYFPSPFWDGTNGGSGGSGGGGGGQQPQPTNPQFGGKGGSSTQSDQTAPNWSPGTTFTGYGSKGGGKDPSIGDGGGGGGAGFTDSPPYDFGTGKDGLAITPSPGIPGFHSPGGGGAGGGHGGPDPSNPGGSYGGGRGGSPEGRRASNGTFATGGGGGGSGSCSPVLGPGPFPRSGWTYPTNKMYPFGSASGGFGGCGMVLISYPAASKGPLAPWGFPPSA